MLYCMTADVDLQCRVLNFCYGDLLEGRLFDIELCATIVFSRLFNGAGFKLQIIYRRMRNNVITPGAAKKGQSSVLFINVCWNRYLLWYIYINVSLNWEKLTMKLGSSFVFKRIATWRTTVWRRKWFIFAHMSRSYEPQDTGPGRDTDVIIKHGWGKGNSSHNVVTMLTLYHEAIFQNLCSLCKICQTHACFWTSLRVLPCRSCFMIGGRCGW
jgi:hypothetical protein